MFIGIGAVVSCGGAAWAGWAAAHGDGEALIVASTLDLVFVPMALGAWRWGLHPFLALGAEGLLIRNPYGASTLIPWEQIAGCSPGYSGVTISTSEGEELTAWAVQKWNLARWFGIATRADRLCGAISSRAG